MGVVSGDQSPKPPGIYRLGLLQQGEQGKGGPFPARPLAVGKAPDRRSGRVPALPYPPLEQRERFPFPFP